MKLKSEVHDYARALRAIGQDLSKLVPYSLELEVVGNDFIVRGEGRAAQSRVAENANPNVWQRLQKEVGQREPQQAVPLLLPFERKYTPEDVTRLDEAGAARRRVPDKPPDISGLAEKLRMIGRIVNAKSGRLAKVIDDMDSVTVEYYDEQSTLEPVDLWRGFDG